MKISQTLFIVFLLCKLSLQLENSDIIKILIDFLVKLNRSSRHVRAFLCWSK
ncbi:Ionotropic receptor 75g, partial [Diabrotica virgifera virgifera]